MPTGVYVRTKECIEKLSKSHVGKHLSKSHIDAISNSHKGLHHSDETKHKIAKMQRGKCISVESKIKLSETRKSMHLSEQTKRKIAESLTGCKRSEKTKQLLSEAAVARMERQLKSGKVKWANTKPEMLMYEGLLSRGYIVEKQKYIKGVVRVDFYLQEYNVIVEADGEHWHNLPGAQERDRIRTEKMIAMGYKVLRFWEHEIKSDLQTCLNKINEVITC